MIKHKCGKIVNIASALGHRPLSYVGAYSATKAALIQVTKSQSIELARYNICVNAIAPGYILTDINRHQLMTIDISQNITWCNCIYAYIIPR